MHVSPEANWYCHPWKLPSLENAFSTSSANAGLIPKSQKSDLIQFDNCHPHSADAIAIEDGPFNCQI